MTAHDLSDGCPEDSAAHWRDLYESADRRATEEATKASRLLQEQVRHDRDVYAAARRAAWDEVLFNTNLYVKGGAYRELYDLSWQLGHIPDKPKPADLMFLSHAAQEVTKALDSIDVEAPGTQLGELRRLRDAVNAAGRRLHAEMVVPDETDHCRCAGCELIREVYLSDQEESDHE